MSSFPPPGTYPRTRPDHEYQTRHSGLPSRGEIKDKLAFEIAGFIEECRNHPALAKGFAVSIAEVDAKRAQARAAA